MDDESKASGQEDTAFKETRSGWVEGTVDHSKPFFLLVNGTVPTALLGQTETEFILQWLCKVEAERETVKRYLQLYLSDEGTAAMKRMGRWNYLIYHATTTAANFYAQVHWDYIKPPMMLEQAIQAWA